MKNIWLPAFILVSLLHLAGVATEHETLIFMTKPLLMPALAVWFLMETRQGPAHQLKTKILAGLAFATLGDVLLLYGDQPLYFMFGLVAFLLTHLSYIGGFTGIRGLSKGYLRQQPMWVLPFAFFVLGLVGWLWPGIPAGMKLPVSIYAAVITTMALSVANLKGVISARVRQVMLMGAILFMLSDSLIAVSRFGSGFPVPRAAIIVTYIIGQFLIVRSARDILWHDASKPAHR